MVTISTAIALQLITIVISVASAWGILNQRVKQLEQHNQDNKDVRDRLIIIETLVREIKKAQ